jgi:SAM-dependent methyltransferase
MLTARIERLRLKPGDRVIDIGCGEGRHSHGVQMLSHAQAIGVDLDAASISTARERAADLPVGAHAALFQESDATALPFADASFDAAICSEVLEHVPDMSVVRAEAARVVKPGGVLAVTVPRVWPEWLNWKLAPGPDGYADQPGGHVRIIPRTRLRRDVEAAGFHYLGGHHAHALHSPYWWLKTALWSRRDDHPVVKAWHRLLVWDMMRRPAITQVTERLLNPVMGKSLALYFERR